MRLVASAFRARLLALGVAFGLALAGCGSRSALALLEDEQGSGGTGAGTGGSTSADQAPLLCVFDYDLTLSSHLCPDAKGPAYFCRENTCDTYGWFSQCLGKSARAAVAECVRRGAFIGIASHAGVDNCWVDKVVPVVTQRQFPEFLDSPKYAAKGDPLGYPAIDVRSNWNCEDCAYTMDGGVSKPNGIRRIMRHYRLDPERAADRKRVIFWDDTPSNITAVQAALPEARAVLVPRFSGDGANGGCGLTDADIAAGFAR